jgi:hypothetical protein
MGLDMYLTAKRDIWGFDAEDKNLGNSIQKLFPELSSAELDDIQARFNYTIVNSVKVEVGYWRKANAIHNWFVENVQGGEDECHRHEVTRDNLKALKTVCEAVLEDRSKSVVLLPTRGGFFFGSTDYDEGYYQDIADTIEIIDRCLKLPEKWSFEYLSSW